MLPAWLEPDVFAVLFLGAAGPLLGLIALLGRKAPEYRPRWAVAAVAFGVLAVVAAVAGQPRGLWLPPAALAGLCGAFQALRSDRLAWAAAALLATARRPAVQAAALIATGPALVVGWMGWNLPDARPWQIPPNLRIADKRPPLSTDSSCQATTDSGRRVPLYHPAEAEPPTELLRAADLSAIGARGLAEGLIRTGPASDDCNCYGWVFTGGRAWIVGADVPGILRDNGYSPVNDPRPGDLVVYRQSGGGITHAAVVRASAPADPILVEGKWGEGGRFLSSADNTPYGAPSFYRSPRRGHLLRGLDVPAYKDDKNAFTGDVQE